MKTKEIKELAKKIAKAEYTLRHTDDSKIKAKAEGEILYYSNQVTSMEDMVAIDEKVTKLIEKMEASD